MILEKLLNKTSKGSSSNFFSKNKVMKEINGQYETIRRRANYAELDFSINIEHLKNILENGDKSSLIEVACNKLFAEYSGLKEVIRANVAQELHTRLLFPLFYG